MKNKKLIIFISSLLFGVVLLTYYIRPVISQAKTVEFDFTITSGDEEALKDLTFFGNVFDQESQTNRQVAITADKTKYSGHPLATSMYLEESSMTTRIRSQYKSFLRGKTLYMGELVESNDYLIFIENNYNYFPEEEKLEKTMTLPLNILDKEANEEALSEIVIQSDQPILQAYISNSLVTDTYLIAEAYFMPEDSYKEDIVLIVYDLQKQEQIFQFEKQLNEQFRMYGSVTDYFLLDETANKILAIETGYITPNNAEINENPFEVEETIVREYAVYDLKTGEKEVLEMPEEFNPNEESSFYARDGMIYNISYSPGKFDILTYDVVKQELAEKGEIYVDETVFGHNEKALRMLPYEDTMLITQGWIDGSDDVLGVVLIDLINQEGIFEGTMSMEETASNKSMYLDDILVEKVNK